MAWLDPLAEIGARGPSMWGASAGARCLRSLLIVSLSLAPFAAFGVPDVHCPPGAAPKTSTRFAGETFIDCVDTSGQKVGPSVAFLATGQLTQRGGYKNGKAEGRWDFLDTKGKVYLWIEFANGEATSAGWTWRNKPEACRKGKPFPDIPVNNSPGRTIACQAAGRQNGPDREWHLDGSPKCEGALLDGVPHGPMTCWWPNGTVSVKGAFDEGVRVGRWTWSRPNGAVVRDETFDANGKTLRWTGDRTWEPNL